MNEMPWWWGWVRGCLVAIGVVAAASVLIETGMEISQDGWSAWWHGGTTGMQFNTLAVTVVALLATAGAGLLLLLEPRFGDDD